MESKKPKLAITAGDINGVGYEVILKALSEPYFQEICIPIIYGNLAIAEQHRKRLDEEVTVSLTPLRDLRDTKENHVYVYNCYADDVPLKIGESTPEAGITSYRALERATEDLKAGRVQAIVTAPINKENIQSPDFQFTGHTEYLTSQFGGDKSLMMMVGDQMRVALVTNHLPISKVASEITEDNILTKLRLLRTSLERDFLLRKPRIAVLALNPHAGDKGLIGTEEAQIIKPAIKKANDEGIWAFGPYSADGFFGSGTYRSFDAILAMYHDQGLIPFKSLDIAGVNYTAGLPIVRTSPDHGTAYEIAGKNQADFTSMAHAIYTAIDVLKARAITQEINSDPMVVTEKHNNKRPE